MSIEMIHTTQQWIRIARAFPVGAAELTVNVRPENFVVRIVGVPEGIYSGSFEVIPIRVHNSNLVIPLVPCPINIAEDGLFMTDLLHALLKFLPITFAQNTFLHFSGGGSWEHVDKID